MRKLLMTFIAIQVIIFNSFGQFTNTDDFVNVNRNYFFNDASGSIPIPTAFNATANQQDEYKYLVSCMRLAKRLSYVFNIDNVNNPGLNFNLPYSENYPTAPSTPVNLFRITKTALNNGYTNLPPENGNSNLYNNKLHGVFIRPVSTASGSKPIVLLTNGAGENFRTQWHQTLYFAADLVMRGYAVFIYENTAIGDKFVSTPGYLNQIHPNSLLFSINDDFRTAFYSYLCVQLGVAAEQYIIGRNVTDNYDIDINRIYAMGGSWGALSSLMFAYSDDIGNVNFNANTFLNNHSVSYFCGGFNAKSRYADSTNYRNRIRGVVGLGANMYTMPLTHVGNIYDAQDANCPSLLLHTNNDNLTPIMSKLVGTVWQYGPASTNFTNNYVNNGIRFHVYVNCDNRGQHYFPSKDLENNIPDFTNVVNASNSIIRSDYNLATINTNKTRTKRYAYFGLQVLSIGKVIGNFLNRSTSITNPITANVSYSIVPTIQVAGTGVIASTTDPFGANDYPDGKFTNTASCITIPNTTYTTFPNYTAGRYANPNVPIEKQKLNLPILYPNPTQGKININIKLDETASDFVLNIYAVNGSQIYTNTINETVEKENYLSKEMDISNQPNGIYFLRVITNNKVLYTNTFVLNK
ncbi:MAG: T9SS type A sorting domain-containing protein [Chitinophagales bacterium]